MENSVATVAANAPSSGTSARVIPGRASQSGGRNSLELSCTPGGTLFATTPGGTRIKYDRSALLNIRNSPLANSPSPHGTRMIPGVTDATSPRQMSDRSPVHAANSGNSPTQAPAAAEDVFDLEY